MQNKNKVNCTLKNNNPGIQDQVALSELKNQYYELLESSELIRNLTAIVVNERRYEIKDILNI
ncbi:hypothetical protein [Lutispora sp.]|uniref:hypothetical protein n=1 Tax=Lutispora sp. TaxID=2828727 RepID=UPI0035682831